MSVRSVLNNIFWTSPPKEDGDFSSYLKKLENGEFKDKIVFGISDKIRTFFMLDPVKQPGALFCGGMGSGKSIAMRFSVSTFLAANSKNSFIILIDPAKGMTDYKLLFKDPVDGKGNVIGVNKFKKNVVAGLDDVGKFVSLIDMLDVEIKERQKRFTKLGASNIFDYEEKVREAEPEYKGLARIMVAIEEFHEIPNHEYIKFHMKYDQNGTIASKFRRIMRIGRSYGVFFMLATQKATSDDVPSQIKPGLSLLMAFRVNQPGEAGALNLPHASDIGLSQRGRCAYEDGFMQYPYLKDEAIIKMLDKYYQPLESELMTYQPEDYQKAFAGDGSSGMVNVKPLNELVDLYQQYDPKDIIKRFMESFNFNLEKQETDAYIADYIATKYGKRYSLRIITNREQGGDKEIKALIKGAEILKCDGLIIMGFDSMMSSIASRAKSNAKNIEVIVVDKDDMKQMGFVLDDKNELISKGKFNEMYLELALSDRRDIGLEIEETDVSDDIEDEEEYDEEEVFEKKEVSIKNDDKDRMKKIVSKIDNAPLNKDTLISIREALKKEISD